MHVLVVQNCFSKLSETIHWENFTKPHLIYITGALIFLNLLITGLVHLNGCLLSISTRLCQ